MGVINNVKEEVGRLSSHDRAMLAHWIITNLEETDEPQETVAAAWREELRNRIKEIRTGKVKMIPSNKVWQDLLRSYAKEEEIVVPESHIIELDRRFKKHLDSPGHLLILEEIQARINDRK